MTSWQKLLVHIIMFWHVLESLMPCISTYSKLQIHPCPAVRCVVRCYNVLLCHCDVHSCILFSRNTKYWWVYVRRPPAEILRHGTSGVDDKWNISHGLFQFPPRPTWCVHHHAWLAQLSWPCNESLYTVPFELVTPFLKLLGKFLRFWVENEERKNEWSGMSNPTMKLQTSVSCQA